MIERFVCLDTSVLIKALTDEEPASDSAIARHLLSTFVREYQVIAPALAWAEVGSVLRKKIRRGELDWAMAATAWDDFAHLPIEYLDEPKLRQRAWAIAHELQLSTLYDAAFLACAEVASAESSNPCQFWTADQALVARARPRYRYVHDPREVENLGLPIAPN